MTVPNRAAWEVVLFSPTRTAVPVHHLPRRRTFKTLCGRTYIEPSYHLVYGVIRLRWDQAVKLGPLCQLCAVHEAAGEYQ